MILKRAFFLMFVVLLLAACGVNVPGEQDDSPRVIANDEGGALLIEATRAAQRAVSERKTATIQAATMSANQTRVFEERQGTSTAEALRVREQEMKLNATANAVAVESQQTRQAATETSEVRRSEATATAQAQMILAAQSRTAEAQQVTATSYAATSTRGAQALLVAKEQHEATATSEALELRRVQAHEDAARSQAWADFVDSLLKSILAIGGIAMLLMLIVQVARYLDALALRQKLVETRAGTVLIVASSAGYSAQIIKPTPNYIDAGTDDEFEQTQLSSITREAPELLKVTTARGETFVARDDPEAEQGEINRRLALRLLRESLRHYSTLGFDARRAARIATQRDLSWSSETWVRAVNVLKPHVVTKQGRGGGTYCGTTYPTLMQLYEAVGERRITLNGHEASHSPIPEMVAA